MKQQVNCVFAIVISLLSLSSNSSAQSAAELRKLYSQDKSKWPNAHLEQGVIAKEIGLLESVEFPTNNPFSFEKLDLGEKLFHDGNLSRTRQIACASCHEPELGWGDGKRTSFGHNRQRGRRNAPTIENIAFSTHFFWDGRAKTLEQQALMPIQDPLEMNFTLPELVQRLSDIAAYREAFKKAFGDEIITTERIAMALATYQRTITSRLSAFDRFLLASEQKDERFKRIYANAMSDEAIIGMHLFRTKAGCMNCHHGPTFSDNKFHNIGLTYYQREYEDLGQYNVTKNTDDVGKFKTPSLRGVMNSKPWMHNGLFSSMRGILNFYNAGGAKYVKKENDPMSPHTSELLKPLALNQQEIEALMAFLEAISGPPAAGPNREFLRRL